MRVFKSNEQLCIVLVIMCLTSVTSHKKTGCIQVNHCKYIVNDGSGVIDLAALGDSDGFLVRYGKVPAADVSEGSEILVSFSPCHPFSEPVAEIAATECLDVAVCLIVRHHAGTGQARSYLNFGRHEGGEFNYSNQTQTLSVTYPALYRSSTKTMVHYRCSGNRSVSYSQVLSSPDAFEIFVQSPCACPNRCYLEDVGPGTIILIILCLAAAAYFILGSCALRPIRTPNGIQIVPEENMWCVLCYAFAEKQGRKRRKSYCLKGDTF
ncbi:uncharacterized protein LOC121309658 [Polyodon spathula]|uniref:uncharacterized protein LOC121309658 n=1 Tax=Polyodon spathula TaxID=7913 RepID=UPI001B7DD607|nr:uncharacterized protein LOC121309658 [Polyodon spathula]